MTSHAAIRAGFVRGWDVNRRTRRAPILLRHYHRYLRDGNTAAFIQALAGTYTVATLARLGTGGPRITRRAAILGLGFLGGYEVNPVVAGALRDPDRGVRLVAESGLRAVWCRAGNTAQQQRLANMIRLNLARRYEEARELASELIEEAPGFAEAWNQRAIACFQLGQYHASISDCEEVLARNLFHFAAASGMGQCHLELDEPQAALNCFRRALELNPSLEAVRVQIRYLVRALEER